MSLEYAPSRQTSRAAFTVEEFCDAYRISRSQLYKMWKAGTGPRFMCVGVKKLITNEAAADWRRMCETAAKQQSAA
jgi:hypothetical protein